MTFYFLNLSFRLEESEHMDVDVAASYWQTGIIDFSIDGEKVVCFEIKNKKFAGNLDEVI